MTFFPASGMLYMKSRKERMMNNESHYVFSQPSDTRDHF